jgi:hypothetical protein
VSLSNVVTMPNGGNTVNTAWLNLVQPGTNTASPPGGQASPPGPYVEIEKVLLNIQISASSQASSNTTSYTNVYLQQAPALANGAVDTGNITNVPLRSAFAATAVGNVPYLVAISNGTAWPSQNIIDMFNPLIKQYVRASIVADANASTNATDSTLTIQLYF